VIGAALSLAALVPAAIIVCRRRRHWPVTTCLAVSLAYACLVWLDAPARVQLAVYVAVAGCNALAYLDTWATRWRALSVAWLGAALAVGCAPGTATWWGPAQFWPSLCAVAVGAVGWWRCRRQRPVVGRSGVDITVVCATGMLLFDGAALLVPAIQAYQGRVQAVLMALVQVGWLVLERAGPRRV